MKVAVLSESPDNEAAIRILVRAILEQEADVVGPPRRARGWPNVKQLVRPVLADLSAKTDVDALAVIADSDDSTVHSLAHERPQGAVKGCRLCQLRDVIDMLQKSRHNDTSHHRIMTAVGIPVPCIEAWYLCGTDHQVSEEDWTKGTTATSKPYTRNHLKRCVYGTDRPDHARRMRHAVQSAERLADSVDQLEALFPGGFGPFVRDVRSWSV